MKKILDAFTTPSEKSPNRLLTINLIISMLLGGLSVVLGEYIIKYFEDEKRLLPLLFIMLAVFGIFTAFAIIAYRKIPKPITTNSISLAALISLQSYFVCEVCINAIVVKTYIPYFIMGFFMYFVVYVLGIVIFKKPKIYMCIVNVIFTVYAIVQYYVIEFRGSPLKLSDFDSLKSATTITDEYSPTFSIAAIFAAVQLAAILFLIIKLKLTSLKGKVRLISLASVVAGAAAFALFTPHTYEYGINNRLITLNYSEAEDTYTSQTVGSLLMFYYDGVFNRVQCPSHYSKDKAVQILSAYTEVADAPKKPTVIAIMNESFADFSHINSFETNMDYMPNYHSLNENTIKGYVTVSAYGGYSCNSEYEFLTGNSMYFLPSGSAPFANYMDGKHEGLVSWFNELDYETVALTICDRNTWNIGTAYEDLQFKTSYFSDNVFLSSIDYINNQVSDKSLYNELIEVYENRNRSEGLFVWTTTMQNHGPYKDDIDGGVELTDIDNESAERFLNSIYQSDKALGELIEYFERQSEHVVIVMFGDHYPHIPEFTEELYGRSISGMEVEDYSRLHQTPFLIWSNQPMESQMIDEISLNYLSNIVMESAGLPKSAIAQELDKVRQQIPIISGFGCKDKDGNWHSATDSDNAYQEILDEYNIIQYYEMFEEK